MTTTITRLFDHYPDATNAVRDLEAIGIPHSEISIVANNADGFHGKDERHDHTHDHIDNNVNKDGDVSRGASTGAAIGGVGGLLAGLGLLAIPGLGPIVAAGWLLSTVAGVGIGAAGGAATGSIVGALKSAGHTEEDANVYAEGVRRGGTLVSARVPDDRIEQANTVLNRNKSVDAGVRGKQYRETGWNSFDEKAPAYSREQINTERGVTGDVTNNR